MKTWIAAFILIALTALSFPAGASEGVSDVERAEKYLRALTTAKARFIQTTHDGSQFPGTFYLNRPGKLRFEYDEPIEDFIVADGFFIYFYDSQLGEQTNAPIGQTLADFLLRTDLKLSGDIAVSEAKKKGGLLQLTLTQTDDPESGSLSLAFKNDPFRLKKWRVVDAQGLITEVELFQLETGMPLQNSLFVYRDPEHGTAANYNE